MARNSNISKLRYTALIINISSVYIALGLLISLQPPFYPSEAELKGAKPSEYGFVFGIANLSLFIFSPIFGKYGSKIGPKICFNCGAVMQGVSGFLFAFLPYCDGVVLFISLSYLLRFIEGLGTAMAWSSALGILMQVFPNKVASVMSLTQTCFGLGYMLGPAVGAWLYESGGFMLPFLVVGSISTILSILLTVTIPNKVTNSASESSENVETKEGDQDVENSCDSEGEGNGEETPLVENSNVPNGSATTPSQVQLGFKDVICHPSLMMPFIDLFAALCGNGMLESMLEPHLRETGASTLDVGLSFLVFGCCYMVGNMFFGQAIDYLGNEKPAITKQKQALLFSMMGNALFMTAFIFVGPLPFVHLRPTKELIRGMMALAGLSYASIVVSSFARAQNRVLQMGFADDMNTYVMISGIWLSAFSLGNFVGPTIAGFLVTTEGFRTTTLIFFILYLLMLVIDIFEAIHRKIQDSRQAVYEQIE